MSLIQIILYTIIMIIIGCLDDDYWIHLGWACAIILMVSLITGCSTNPINEAGEFLNQLIYIPK